MKTAVSAWLRRFDFLALLFVICLELLGCVHHLLDIFFRELLVALNGDCLLVAGAQILGRDMDDTVRIDIERDLNLGYPAGCRGDAGQLEFSRA